MRKLFLASFRFTTGDLECHEQRLVVMTESDFRAYRNLHDVRMKHLQKENPDFMPYSPTESELATDKAKVWFEKTFVESKMVSIMAHEAIDDIEDSYKSTDKIGMQYPPFHNSDERPAEIPGTGFSEDVLIDVDRWRKKFVVGWYDYNDNEWQTKEQDVEIDQKNMKWTYLPHSKEVIHS